MRKSTAWCLLLLRTKPSPSFSVGFCSERMSMGVTPGKGSGVGTALTRLLCLCSKRELSAVPRVDALNRETSWKSSTRHRSETCYASRQLRSLPTSKL